MSNRYNDGGNFITPHNGRREAANISVEPWVSGDVVRVEDALAVQSGSEEKTSAVDRSVAWVIRIAPYTVLSLVLSVSLVWLADGGWALGFALFAGFTLALYVVLDKQEYTYSRNGLERHKVNVVREVALLREENKHEVVMTVVKGQLEMWRAQNGAGNATLTDGGGKTAGRIAGPSAEG